MGSSNGQPSGDTDEYVFQYSRDEMDQPSMAIVEAVARVLDTDITDLGQLSKEIDPEAMNELLRGPSMDEDDFARSPRNQDSTPPRIRFAYEGAIVTVRPGWFTIEPV